MECVRRSPGLKLLGGAVTEAEPGQLHSVFKRSEKERVREREGSFQTQNTIYFSWMELIPPPPPSEPRNHREKKHQISQHGE